MAIQGSWEKDEREIGCKVEKYTWIIREIRKGQDSKNRGMRGVLLKEFLREYYRLA